MPQLCSWPNGGYNAEHVGPPVVAAAHPPGRLLAESIDELDRLIGTWGFISRLPLHRLISAIFECAADRLWSAVDSLFSRHSLPTCKTKCGAPLLPPCPKPRRATITALVSIWRFHERSDRQPGSSRL